MEESRITSTQSDRKAQRVYSLNGDKHGLDTAENKSKELEEHQRISHVPLCSAIPLDVLSTAAKNVKDLIP